MRRQRFDRIVEKVLDSLPEEFAELLDNVVVFTEDAPSAELLAESEVPEGETLFGLYEGVPLTERTNNYGLVAPDRITIFQKPIEEACETEDEVAQQIRRTVLHELAHFFGIEEDRMDEIEAQWDQAGD
ncbi:metallopeptidase family protein [Chloroflexota bacterium]